MDLLFLKNGIDYLKTLSKKEVVSLYQSANQKYYNESQPLFSDEEYDILKDYVEQVYPNEIEIGAPVSSGKKVKLPIFMGSMNKIKSDQKVLQSWTKKYAGPYVCSAKLDGISALFDGRTAQKKLYTRGNGTVGQDISKFIPHLHFPVSSLDVMVRGELIIRKSMKMENKRNQVSGIINSKIVDAEKMKLVEFVPYEVIFPIMTPSNQMAFLEKYFSTVVEHRVVNQLDTELLSKQLLDWRANNSYEIDGVVCTSDQIYARNDENPKHSFAFKMVLTEQISEATVINVIWTISKDGYIKPKVQFSPVWIGGVKIEFATAFNAAYVRDQKIGVGAVVQLIRSGDVIPYIVKVIKPASTIHFPPCSYNWNETNVDIIVANLSENEAVKKQCVLRFFEGLKIDGFGKTTIQNVFDSGYQEVHHILKMTLEDFKKLNGIQEKTASKIVESMQEKVKQASIPTLMALSNIFDRGFGEKKLNLLVRTCPTWYELNNENQREVKYSEYEDLIINVKGMTEKSAKQFLDNIPSFLEFLRKCKLNDKIGEKNPNSTKEIPDLMNERWKNKKIVFSGFRSDNLTKEIELSGGVVLNSVSKQTDLVLVKDNTVESSKTKKAKALSIPIETVKIEQ